MEKGLSLFRTLGRATHRPFSIVRFRALFSPPDRILRPSKDSRHKHYRFYLIIRSSLRSTELISALFFRRGIGIPVLQELDDAISIATNPGHEADGPQMLRYRRHMGLFRSGILVIYALHEARWKNSSSAQTQPNRAGPAC